MSIAETQIGHGASPSAEPNMELGILPAPAVPTTSSPSLTPLAREDEDEPKQYQHGRVNGAAAGMVSNVVAPTAQPPNRRPTTKPKFGERPDCFKSTVQEALFALQSTVALGLTSLLTGATVILTASIGRELGMTQGEVSWISASAALVSGAFQLSLGQLADLLGRKLQFLAGLALFALISILTGLLARNPLALLVAQGFLGLCCAAVVPPAAGILGAAYAVPSRRKNVVFACLSCGNPLGFVAGTLVSGIAVRVGGSWRAAYVVLAIISAAWVAVGVWVVPSDSAVAGEEPNSVEDVVAVTNEAETASRWDMTRLRMRSYDMKKAVELMKRFDAVGTVLTIVGTGLFTASLTLGPSDGWKSAHVVAFLVVGISMLAVFILWERYFPYPLMPLHVWKDWNFTWLMTVVLPGFMSFISSCFWLAYFMQEVQRLDTLVIALRLLPQEIAGLAWNLLAGIMLHKVNNTLMLFGGSISYVAANLLLCFMKPDSSYWAFMFPSLILNVVGADFQFNVANMYVMQSLPSHQQSLASGIFATLIRLCTTIILGISTAVFASVAATPAGRADQSLSYTRAFQVSVGFAAFSLLCVPFVKLKTQGNIPVESGSVAESETAEAKS